MPLLVPGWRKQKNHASLLSSGLSTLVKNTGIDKFAQPGNTLELALSYAKLISA